MPWGPEPTMAPRVTPTTKRTDDTADIDEQSNPHVVMQVGGWDPFQAIEAYLTPPTPDVVNEAV